MMAGSRLSLSEREEIRAGIERGESATEIACRLERHSSTVSREIAANGGREEYRAVNAHDRAVALAARPKPFKLVEDPQLASEVTELLVERKYSPQTCARMLSAAGKPISHETIYRACYQRGRGLDGDCWKSLPRRRQRRRHGGRQWGEAHSSPLGVITSVHRRHRIVADRSQAGHLEGDLLIGANNASAVLVTCERVSRKTFLETLPHGYGAEPVAMALCRLLDQIPPEMRRTLTWDQGREMKYWADVQAVTGTLVYFCDPHAPWQKPTVENTNGILRRWLPKGTPLDIHTPTDLEAIAALLNSMPRPIHQWRSADDVYHRLLGATTS